MECLPGEDARKGEEAGYGEDKEEEEEEKAGPGEEEGGVGGI